MRQAAGLVAGLRRHGPATLLLLVLAGLALWPLPRLLWSGQEALGHPIGDLADHYWGTWWAGSELLAGRWPSRPALMRFPEQTRLWYVDPVGAILSLPLRVLGFPRAWNALLLLQVFLSGLLAYAMGLWASGSRTAAFVPAALLIASPYALSLVHSGLSEYLGLAAPVAFTWALLVALGRDPRGRAPPRRAAVVAGLLLALCAAQAFYYAAFGAVLLGCALLGPGWRGRLRPAMLAGLCFGLAAAPLFLAAWSAYSDPDSAITQASAPGWNYKRLPAVDLLTWFRPGEYYFPDTRASNPGVLHVNYLGLVGVSLAALGFRRQAGDAGPGPGVLAWPVTAYAVLALGPRLCLAGEFPTWGGGAIPLPLAALYLPYSPFRFVHHPYRMVALLLPLLGLLAARGALALPRPARLLAAAAILGESLLASPAPWPLATTDTRAPAIYAELPAGPVLDWPPDATTWNRRYVIWQVSHGRPIAYGVNTFLPEALRSDPLVSRLVLALANPARRAANRDVPYEGRAALPFSAGPSGMADLGFQALVLHGAALTEGERRRATDLLTEAFGVPEPERGGALWWRVR